MRRAFARVGAARRLVASRLFQLAKIDGRLKELRPLSQSRLLFGPNNESDLTACLPAAESPPCDLSLHVARGRRCALRLGWPMGARHGPPRVGTMLWTSRAALGAGGRNGTDRVVHKPDEEPHRAGP